MSPTDLLPDPGNVRDDLWAAGVMLVLSLGIAWGTSRYKRMSAAWQWATFAMTEVLIGMTAAFAILRFGVAAGAWGVIALLVMAAAFLVLDVRSGGAKVTHEAAPVPETPPAIPRTVLSIVDARESEAVFLTVQNRGERPADVWCLIAVRKGVSDWPAGLFAQWEGADEPRVTIAPGHLRRVIVARYLRFANGGCSWVLPFLEPDGQKGESTTPRGLERPSGSTIDTEFPKTVEILVTFMAEPATEPLYPSMLINLYGERVTVK